MAMATKDQERAALAKIRKIVEGLGEDSYIGMAFEGCFDDAEYNIENDFANSFKGRYERCLKEALDKDTEIKILKAANAELNAKIESLNGSLDRAAVRENDKQETIVRLRADYRELKDQLQAMQKEMEQPRYNVRLKAKDGDERVIPNATVTYHDNGIQFINVVEESGWTTSWRISDLEVFAVE